LRPENGLTEAKKISSNPFFPTENLFRIKKSTALALSMQNYAPAQGFPRVRTETNVESEDQPKAAPFFEGRRCGQEQACDLKLFG
jgi:hypothetical protein